MFGRGPHRKLNLGLHAGQLDRDLRGGVTGTDDENPLIAIARRLPIGRRMTERPRKCREARPIGDGRCTPVAGGYHHRARQPGAFGRLDPPAGRIASYPRDLDAELGRDLETRGIVVEIRDQIVPADPEPGAFRDRRSGQGRKPAGGVQVQAVVATAPGRSDRIRALEKRVRSAVLAEHRGDREAAWPGTHDDRLVSHAGTLRRRWRR